MSLGNSESFILHIDLETAEAEVTNENRQVLPSRNHCASSPPPARAERLRTLVVASRDQGRNHFFSLQQFCPTSDLLPIFVKLHLT